MLLIGVLLYLISCNSSYSENRKSDETGNNSAFQEEEIKFKNGDTSLFGTLYRPISNGKHHAVVILSGSDRSRRGPLRIKIAEYFALNKIAALVYDSPGTGRSSGNAFFQTRHDRVIEALAAAEFLRGQSGIRSNAIGLFGGSEGGDISVLAAAKSPDIAFVIPVSSSLGVSILDVLGYSAEKKGYRDGLTMNEIIKAKTFKELSFVLFSGVNIVEWSLIKTRVNAWENEPWDKLLEIAQLRLKKLSDNDKKRVLNTFKLVIHEFKDQNWFHSVDIGDSIQRTASLDTDHFFRILDMPRYSSDWDKSIQDVTGIRCPILAIWGEEDSFLPPVQSMARLKKSLDEMKHGEYKMKIFPEASHFLTVKDSRTTFVSGYLELMTDWIKIHTQTIPE